jgi:hypothetical protein
MAHGDTRVGPLVSGGVEIRGDSMSYSDDDNLGFR